MADHPQRVHVLQGYQNCHETRTMEEYFGQERQSKGMTSIAHFNPPQMESLNCVSL